jgi:hypothetical protein
MVTPLLAAVIASSSVLADDGYTLFRGEIRTIPALAFLPVGGPSKVQTEAMSSYLVGGSAGFFNFPQVTMLDASLVMVGVRWSDVVGQGSTEQEAVVSDMVYGRIGPRMRFARGLLGFQVGYGGIIVGDDEAGRTRQRGGIDVSFDLRLLQTHR